jgi:hypothetical protein
MQTVQLSWPLRRVILLPFFLLIICGLLVPSDGGHGILSIKSLAFLSAVVTISLLLLTNKSLNNIQYKTICFLLFSLVFLIGWIFISLAYNETPMASAWDQFKIFWITVSVIAMSLYLVNTNVLSFITLLKTVIYANCLYSTVKIALVFLHIFGVLNIFTVIKFLGIRFMSMDILNTLPRLQTSIDIATPFILFFFLQRKQIGLHLNKYFNRYYLLISALSIFLSFSRFLMFVGLLSVVLHGLTLRFEKVVRIIPAIVLSLILGIAVLGFDNAYAIIENRFFSKASQGSDLDRTEQIIDLMTEHMQFPWFGKGLGSYAENNIRDLDVKHSYEVQWVAFLMQFGLIGISILCVGVVTLSIKILSRPCNRNKVALFILFLAWLFSGFTNPFLVSLTSGILYTLFYLIGIELSQNRKVEDIE